MPEQKVTTWQIPTAETDGHRIKGWIDELIQNGDNWVKGQKSISTIQDDVRLLMGMDQKGNSTPSNSLQIDVRTFVETISDLKMIATLGTKADQYKNYVQVFNGGMKYVYHDSNFVAQTRKALQYAMLGRGYLWQRYSRDKYGWGKGRIEFPALGPLEVLPEQLPHDNNMQGCYAVTIIVPMPIAEAHARFPKFQEWLKPISRYDWKSYGTLGLARRLDFYDRFRFGDQDQDWDNHYALGVDEPIATPTGWTDMGDLKAGDYVFGGDGSLCKVTVAHPIREVESYRITFSDRSSIIASEDHQWITACKKSKGNNRVGEEKLRTTKEIFETQEMIHQIEAVAIDTPHAWLPVDPYLLGVWLGDGCKTSGTICGLPEDLREIEKILHSRGHKTVSFSERPNITQLKAGTLARLRVEGFERALRTAGILHSKRIPMQFLRASREQRLDLLRGIMDTDGWVTRKKRVNGEPASQCGWGQTKVHKLLAEDMSELLNSLGIKNTFGIHTGKRFGNEYIWHYTQLSPLVNVFNLPRKRDKQVLPMSRVTKSRYIADVQPVGKQSVRCITVNSDDHTFLAGRSMIRTHNCDIRYTFTRDLRINRSGYEIDMESGTPWGYKVPSVGQLIVTTNPFNGLPESRDATEQDCRMYPQLRLTITSPSVPIPMRDKCGFDWHGEIPVVQYDVNDWVWSPLGYSLIRQVAGIEKASRGLLSKMQEVTDVNLDPPLGYDLHSGVSRTQLEKIDMLRSSGFRVGVNGKPDSGLVSILPQSMKVGEEHFKQLEVLDAQRQKTLGLTDITSMRDLKLNLSSENVDKILENLGPVGNGIANSIGIANGKHAQMLKHSIPQYISVQELMDWVGPDGVTIETFDNDPTSLIPDRLPSEIPTAASRYEKRERSKWFADKLNVTSTPMQLLNITEMQERMTYLMFMQRGAKVSTGTIMEKLGVQNYGGAKGDTEHEKWLNEQIEDQNFKVQAEVALVLAMQEAGIQPPGQPPGAAPAPGAGQGQGHGGGRPNTDAAPPRQEMRGTTTGNPRVILSTSK